MNTFKTVNVNLGTRSYAIVVGQQLIDHAAEFLAPLVSGHKSHIITDSNLVQLYYDRLAAALRGAGSEVSRSIIRAGEQHKTLSTVTGMLGELIKAGLDRGSRIVALGGGVTGDMAGFTASIYMRGISFIQIPTSLLAMVDSSVGGKTGVDLPEGKNLVGAFWQPELVLIDPALLRSLPERELRCGWAEIVKYGVIVDRELFRKLEEQTALLTSLDLDFYTEIICRCCELKAEIVADDEHEIGRRAILNYGHTFGHAIEAVSDFNIGHGEGVSIGMCMAADLAVKTGMLAKPDAERQETLLRRLGMPVSVSGLDPEAIVRAMSGDKKKRDGKLTFILPHAIGNVSIERGMDVQLVLDAVRGRCD